MIKDYTVSTAKLYISVVRCGLTMLNKKLSLLIHSNIKEIEINKLLNLTLVLHNTLTTLNSLESVLDELSNN